MTNPSLVTFGAGANYPRRDIGRDREVAGQVVASLGFGGPFHGQIIAGRDAVSSAVARTLTLRPFSESDTSLADSNPSSYQEPAMIRVSFIMLLALVVATGVLGLTESLRAEEPKANAPAIVVRSQLIEIDRGKMRRLGFDLSILRRNGSVHTAKVGDGDMLVSSLQVAADEKPSCGKCACSGVIEGLRKNGLARLLADPTITVVAGRRGAISIGSTVEAGNAARTFIGTKLQVHPEVANDRIRVDYHLEHTYLVEDVGADQSESPESAHATFETETTFEVHPGETLIIGGLLNSGDASKERSDREIVLLVTPELAERKPTRN